MFPNYNNVYCAGGQEINKQFENRETSPQSAELIGKCFCFKTTSKMVAVVSRYQQKS